MAIVGDGAAYADAVIAGEIPVCQWVRRACQRFIDDLDRWQHDESFSYRFDADAAQKILDFCRICKHSKGVWAGQEFEPEPWQVFILVNLFGWVHKFAGLRRFRTALIDVPRKNGKSTLLAVIGLYMLTADREAGAEVYAAATNRQQAKLIFDESKRMVKSSPHLRRHVGTYQNNLHVTATASKFEPLAADADNLDGLNSHCNLVDELHAHKTRNLWDVLETGTGARTQSLQIAITTAGFNQQSICFEQRDYLIRVLQGVIDDPTYFGVIYTAEEKDADDNDLDDWRKESTWIKANPNWGISVFPDDMRRLARKAMEIPASQNNFKAKRLSIWTQQETRWLDVDAWNASGQPVDAAELEGRECFGGLDLSSKLDLSAFVLCFPPDAERDDWVFVPKFWIPKDNIQDRIRRDKVPLDAWARDGWLELTPGNVIDYAWIQKHINDVSEIYSIQEIGYDPWNATQTAIELQDDGFAMVEVRQGYRSMSEPSKEFEALIAKKSLSHGDHPVMRWCISNVAKRQDPNENICPDKDKSSDRVDGVVAAIMALGRAIRREAEDYTDAGGISVV